MALLKPPVRIVDLAVEVIDQASEAATLPRQSSGAGAGEPLPAFEAKEI